MTDLLGSVIDRTSDSELLRNLSRDVQWNDVLLAAVYGNPHTPEEVLRDLLESADGDELKIHILGQEKLGEDVLRDYASRDGESTYVMTMCLWYLARRWSDSSGPDPRTLDWAIARLKSVAGDSDLRRIANEALDLVGARKEL